MNCPFCHALDTKVIDSRLSSDGGQVRRRRRCLVCHERFTTFEMADLHMPLVVKRDGRREPFNVKKLRAGMLRALEKRPVSIDALEQSIQTITQKTRQFGEREINSQQIGEWIMSQLSHLDQIAYVRFASVYKRFQDVSEFQLTIDTINAQPIKNHDAER